MSKFLIDLFSKMVAEDAQHPLVSGQRPDPTSAEVGTPKTSKEFLFLVLLGLIEDQTGSSDNGEKNNGILSMT